MFKIVHGLCSSIALTFRLWCSSIRRHLKISKLCSTSVRVFCVRIYCTFVGTGTETLFFSAYIVRTELVAQLYLFMCMYVVRSFDTYQCRCYGVFKYKIKVLGECYVVCQD